MNIILYFKLIESILEIIFLCLAIYYFIRELKMKKFEKAIKYFSLYLVLNIIRRIIGY